MPLDLVSQFTLYFFGACFAGGLVGLAVGWLLGFETGIGVGLLFVGCVALSYTPRFWTAQRDFETHPLRARGTVVAIEDRAVNAAGDVTTPVAIVEYETARGEKRRVPSRGGSGLEIGASVVVVPDASAPGGARVGVASQMQGGVIASLLFGTFPFSGGLFFLASALVGRREERLDRVSRRRETERATRPSRVVPVANAVMFFGILGPVAVAGLYDTSVLRTILTAFALAALGMWIHVIDGFRMRRDLRWTLGIAVIALNFSVWCAALWGLSAPEAGW